MTTQDEVMVRSAATRAAVMGWLNRNPGAHVVKEIADGAGEDSQRVRNALRSLADSGQVLAEGEGQGRGRLVRWSSPDAPQPPEGPQLPLPAVAKAHPPAKKKKPEKVGVRHQPHGAAQAPVRLVPERQRAPGELEIVVAGVTVVVGRNPETGRIRIGILEEDQ